ncbi:hypothetical protein HELRODRAFT_134536, partial [Helobdella robusta]|uniref:Peptidase metallopeptidase domain-containing protein n=1 Tax=Helobdella robusta TaxID=6412 RepID=T1EI52_HELRO
GRFDERTKNVLMRPRCQFPDIIQTSERSKRFSTLGKWAKTTLTYVINSYPTYPSDINGRYDVEQLLAQSFKDWASVSRLSFQQSSNNSTADIQIGFYKRDHGDGFSFDGMFGILAHAFVPEYGKLHFDDDEMWSRVDKGFNLFLMNLRQVATHEIGHLLGLGHSSVPKTVMYPFHYYTSNFMLTDDDIKGIETIYGQ